MILYTDSSNHVVAFMLDGFLISKEGANNIDNWNKYEIDTDIKDTTLFNYDVISENLVLNENKQKEEVKSIQEEQLNKMMSVSMRVSFLNELSDEQAVMIPLCYDAWITGKAYKVGDRVEWEGKLWKCRQAHTSQENYKPSIDTASLWEVIDVEHAGTLEDPIPYDQTMTVNNGKYYLEDGIIYKCIRDSGQPLYASCASLVGNYFEVAQ